MAVSALLGVATPTPFINPGMRHNQALLGQPGTFAPHGVYVGLVGARYEVQERMEWRYTIVNGGCDEGSAVDKAWRALYGAKAGEGALGVVRAAGGSAELDVALYRRRMRWTLVPFLKHADKLAKEAGKRALVHLVGLGLGVWCVSRQDQPQAFVDELRDILTTIDLPNVEEVNASWFKASVQAPPTTFRNQTRLVFSTRDPAEPVGEDQLLVASFAWDSNSAPGNEYFMGSLAGSGDPAAACCSTVSELGNALVNPVRQHRSSAPTHTNPRSI